MPHCNYPGNVILLKCGVSRNNLRRSQSMSKLRRIIALIMSAAIMLCCFTVSAGAADTQALVSGKKFWVEPGAGKTAVYTFTIEEESEIKLDLTIARSAWNTVAVVDKITGESMFPEEPKITRGFGGFDPNLGALHFCWEMDTEPHNVKAKLTYHLFSGTYELRLKTMTAKEELNPEDYERWVKDGGRDSSGRFTVTASFKSAEPQIDGFEITLKKGTSVRLDTLITGGSGEKAKWTSSKKAVATVNQNGKITAKKAGTAVITAKVGNSKATIQVKVTK